MIGRLLCRLGRHDWRRVFSHEGSRTLKQYTPSTGREIKWDTPAVYYIERCHRTGCLAERAFGTAGRDTWKINVAFLDTVRAEAAQNQLQNRL